jgi:hypothetical protein
MKRNILFLMLGTIVIILFGCSMIKGKGEAEKVAESFLQDRIRDGGLGKVQYYSDKFWEFTDENQWSNIKGLVKKAMGDLQSYSLNTWNTQTKINTNELSGTFVTLVYDTVYEKGKGQEMLYFYKGIWRKEFRILGHQINSPKIQELIDKGIEQVVAEDTSSSRP